MTTPSLFSLVGSRAVVTGGGSGIGRGIAHALAAAGASVVLIGRTDSVERVRDEIIEAGGEADAVLVDLGDTAGVAQIADELADRHPADVLVNCAGVIRRGPFALDAGENWREVFAVNLDAPRILSRAFGDGMRERGRGKIVNIASLLSFQGGWEVASYTSSKHALLGLTRALANEWAGSGVQVNAIAPGYIATDNTAALRADSAREAEILGRIPAGRWGRPDDLAGAAVFLASAASDYITGHTLVVDGGWMSR